MANSEDEGGYREYLKVRQEWKEKILNGPGRFVHIGARDDTSTITHQQFKKLEKGKNVAEWRGVPMSKDPLDCAIYQAILWELKPRTVIEVGTMVGGSTLWLADHVHMFGLACQVIAFDNDISIVHPKVKQREGITFVQGDCNEIEKSFTPDILKELPHPWLVIEDAHVNVKNVLQHFYKFMTSGDYFAVEDGHPSTAISHMNVVCSEEDEIWGYGKMNTIRSFLSEHSDDLMVDTSYTDRFGYNCTFNMNGYIRKM